MKILFVGLLYSPVDEKDILNQSKNGISVASNLYQWNVINGIKENGIDIDVIGSVPFGNYPKLCSKLIIRNRKIDDSVFKYDEIGYINFYWIKHLMRKDKIKSNIKKWIADNSNEKCAIIFYDLYEPFLDIMKWVKQFENVVTSIIVPDLVGNLRNDMGYGKCKSALLNIRGGRILKKIQCADTYILLTEQMNEIVNKNKNPYIVLDGIINEKQCFCENKYSKRIIMYAGALSQQYNIEKLVDSFMHTKNLENLELWFCGKGNAEQYIKSACISDKRIKYFGFVDKEKLKRIEKQVCFYINPRTNNDIFTKYSFPSKNLEYLLAGKGVLAYKLDGMSDDYDDILFYMDQDDDDAMEKMFRKIAALSDTEITLIGKRGYEFVIEHNSRYKQCQKIIGMLNSTFMRDRENI